MPTLTPSVFRASLLQRSISLLLSLGTWLAMIRALMVLFRQLPHLEFLIQRAHQGDASLWMAYSACLLWGFNLLSAGFILALSLLGFLLVEGTHVLLDDLGLTVENTLLPTVLAQKLGADRLTWKRIGRIERGLVFFVIRGGGEGKPEPGAPQDPTLRILLVHELEQLVNQILLKSPNLRLQD